MKKLNKKGFTLIELMIVIAIIAILAAILVPNFVKARAQGQLTACKSNLKNLGTAAEMFSADHNGRYPTTLSTIKTDSYMKVLPSCPLTPSTSYSYGCTSNPDYYWVLCTSGRHEQAGTKSGQQYPQFDSEVGLVCPLETDSSDMQSYKVRAGGSNT